MAHNLRRVDDVDRVTNQYGVQGGRVLRQKIGSMESSLDAQVCIFLFFFFISVKEINF